MNNPISALRILPAELDPAAISSASGPKNGFLETLRETIQDMEHLQNQAQSKVAGLVEGNGMDVHSAMIAVEKADLSFQLMMQVRNKIVAAYQEIARLQF